MTSEIMVSGFMTLSPLNECVLQYVEKSWAQIRQGIDDWARVQKIFNGSVPNTEAVDFDESADLSYGLSASDGIVWGAIREQ